MHVELVQEDVSLEIHHAIQPTLEADQLADFADGQERPADIGLCARA